MTREEIIKRYEDRLCAALRGEEREIGVCGLGIETVRDEILAERDYLLKEHGFDVPIRRGKSVSLE